MAARLLFMRLWSKKRRNQMRRARAVAVCCAQRGLALGFLVYLSCAKNNDSDDCHSGKGDAHKSAPDKQRGHASNKKKSASVPRLLFALTKKRRTMHAARGPHCTAPTDTYPVPLAQPDVGAAVHETSQHFVCAGLPIELWMAIVSPHADDRRTLSAVSAVCRALRDVAMAISAAKIRQTRALMDCIVDKWERESVAADEAWAAGVNCHRCEDLVDDDDSNAEHSAKTSSAPSTASSMITTVRHASITHKATHVARGRNIVSTYDNTLLCDDCAADALAHARGRVDHGDRDDHDSDTDGDSNVDTDSDSEAESEAPSADLVVDRVDLHAPHIWRDYHDNYAPSHAVDDGHFVVPAPLVHSIDLDAAARLGALNTASPFYLYADGTPLGAIPSARSWMPLTTAGVLPVAHYDYEGLFVCCDSSHPAWGSIAAASIAGRSNDFVIMFAWNERIAAKYKQRDSDQRHMDVASWLTYVCYEADDLPTC
ncbi:hypothetical protein pneo_cds_962 [Pandoravirus neocaledonia]|uniref:Uncharacterized protein n=1 Tax=Pandoravirus neocaledonia TaxID=2107708 RepID=A0A2U7UDM0_9VIRU|nr:hypothetical protein pneo_cds_962 [Pandoravirus neocaledonia]AVK76569.1 hypothetical protein pneo_cds_962 [Pandoravirus neocaledonia]